MMDPPPIDPNEILEALTECGVARAEVSIADTTDSSIPKVVVQDEIDFDQLRFLCIYEATQGADLTFTHTETSVTYIDLEDLHLRKIYADGAKEELDLIGKLQGLPRVGNATNPLSYTAALERHCEIEVGTVFVYDANSGFSLIPPDLNNFADEESLEADTARRMCLFSAIVSQGESPQGKALIDEISANIPSE